MGRRGDAERLGANFAGDPRPGAIFAGQRRRCGAGARRTTSPKRKPLCSSASFSSSAYRSGVRPFKNSSGTGAGGASEEGPARPRAEVAAARRGAAARRSAGARAEERANMCRRCVGSIS